MPYMMWRMDKYFNEYRAWCCSWSNDRASTSGSGCGSRRSRSRSRTTRRIWWPPSTYRGPERIIFASTGQHHDFDHPRTIMKLPMPGEAKRKIMGENALHLFGITAPAGKL